MPIAERHLARRARRLGVAVSDHGDFPQEYLITHPDHTPDQRGEFAGQKVYHRGGQQFVKLTRAQSKFYMDQGAITPVVADRSND